MKGKWMAGQTLACLVLLAGCFGPIEQPEAPSEPAPAVEAWHAVDCTSIYHQSQFTGALMDQYVPDSFVAGSLLVLQGATCKSLLINNVTLVAPFSFALLGVSVVDSVEYPDVTIFALELFVSDKRAIDSLASVGIIAQEAEVNVVWPSEPLPAPTFTVSTPTTSYSARHEAIWPEASSTLFDGDLVAQQSPTGLRFFAFDLVTTPAVQGLVGQPRESINIGGFLQASGGQASEFLGGNLPGAGAAYGQTAVDFRFSH